MSVEIKIKPNKKWKIIQLKIKWKIIQCPSQCQCFKLFVLSFFLPVSFRFVFVFFSVVFFFRLIRSPYSTVLFPDIVKPHFVYLSFFSLSLSLCYVFFFALKSNFLLFGSFDFHWYAKQYNDLMNTHKNFQSHFL